MIEKMDYFKYIKKFRYDLRQTVRLTREIFAQEAFDNYRGEEMAPGKDINSDNDLDEFIRYGSNIYENFCNI